MTGRAAATRRDSQPAQVGLKGQRFVGQWGRTSPLSRPAEAAVTARGSRGGQAAEGAVTYPGRPRFDEKVKELLHPAVAPVDSRGERLPRRGGRGRP